MTQASLIRLDKEAKPGRRSGRFSTRELYQGSGSPKAPQGKLLAFPRVKKDRTGGVSTDYSIRLGPQNIARIKLEEVEAQHYWVDWVYVPPGFRGQGLGRLLLAALIRDADREGVQLSLEARACATISQAQLEVWYGSMGFRRTGRVGEFGPVLARSPRARRRRAA